MSLLTNKIYNEDCLQTLGRMDNNSIHAVITSPPYNIGLRIHNGEYIKRGDDLWLKYDNFNDCLPIDDYFDFHCNVLDECFRVAKVVFWNIQIIGGSKEAVFKIIGKYAKHLKDIIIWDKGFGQPAIGESVLNSCYEMILIFESLDKKGRRLNYAEFDRGTIENLWRIPNKRIVENHKAVFPVNLVGKILLCFSKEGDLIYDPFIGTGTTAVACIRHKRNFIGSEISSNYCDIANTRIKEEQSKLLLF